MHTNIDMKHTVHICCLPMTSRGTLDLWKKGMWSLLLPPDEDEIVNVSWTRWYIRRVRALKYRLDGLRAA